MVHPLENIRAASSRHLEGRHIVMAVCGSIAAVRSVEVARELARHGAQVTAVMSRGAQGILHPDALHFATGRPPITSLTGAVEHVALLGRVPGHADLLLVCPATANTVAKMALGVDDTPVTTCATVAAGSGIPIVVAAAMHEVMLDHPAVAQHVETLRARGVVWVEPTRQEAKAKLASPEAVAEAVMHTLASRGGLLAGVRALVVGGATAEPVDAVRILTNRSSGTSAIVLAQELRRRGAAVELWLGHATHPLPDDLEPFTWRFATHAELMGKAADARGFDQVWMPAAIADYVPEPQAGKARSGKAEWTIRTRPAAKVVETLRAALPDAQLVAFKAEAEGADLEKAARDRLHRYHAAAVVANDASAFGAASTKVLLVTQAGSRPITGTKQQVLAQVVEAVGRPAGVKVPA